MRAEFCLAAVLSASKLINADMYMHFPPGSSNRLNEENREVRNDNRLFDSQNNNRFGYNQAGYYFYQQSIIDLQWTIQHSCGPDSNVNCEVVLQYACHDKIRDGETVDTIPDEDSQCKNGDCSTDFEFGMHESHDYYKHCSLRQRNKRLFPADRNIRGENARFTRQEENGQRYGYECNEERDYYPYWHPTIWRDIVVFTDDTSRCDYYKKESENVKDRFFCDVDKSWINENYNPDSKEAHIPLNETACETFAKTHNVKAVWTLSPSHGIPAPDCRQHDYQRDNHHGNGNGRNFAGYKWTVPNDALGEQCAFRVRYNISSSDYDGWNTDIENKILDDERCMCRNNYGVDLWSQYGWEGGEAKRRGYRHRNDPELVIFDELPELKLRLPYNTDQLGRTFEDRSHKVAFRKLPEDIASQLSTGGKLYNLNVRGKIGNFVEVYPNFEYDFNPQRLQADVNDFVHIQWSGSNTNNNGNDGSQVDKNGNTVSWARKKDRHNMVLIDDMQSIRPTEDVKKLASIFGLDEADAMSLALDGVSGGDNEYLQAAGSYFDLGLRQLKTPGKWMFMSTHNNRFGVRTQKGKIIVS